jgi:thiol-disulfide isomerase/thioredoxin
MLVSAAFASHEPASAPRFTLPTRTGTIALDSLRGRVVLVDFWASWCEPCKRSFPWMAGLEARYGSKGLTIVAINLDKSRDAADDFVARHPAPFTVAFDPAGTTAEAYKVTAMPTSFLVGRNGEILMTHAGFDPHKAAKVEEQIQKACAP